VQLKDFISFLRTIYAIQRKSFAKLVGNNKKSYDLQQAEEKKMAKNFTLEYWFDEGWYVGRLKEAPGIFSQGQTLKELKANIHDAYNMMIAEEQDTLPPKIRGKVKQIQVEI
jgi:predicted RNase H-like HicB family nuclease